MSPESSSEDSAYVQLFLSVQHTAETRPGKSPQKLGNTRFIAVSATAPLCTSVIIQSLGYMIIAFCFLHFIQCASWVKQGWKLHGQGWI